MLALPSTNEHVLLALLDKEELSLSLLLKIKQHSAVTEEVRISIYTHPNADKAIRDSLNNSIRPNHLLSLINKTGSVNSEGLRVLAINPNILHVLGAKKLIDEEVLEAVIAHPKTDSVVLSAVLSRNYLTPERARKVRPHPQSRWLDGGEQPQGLPAISSN
ncbi:MAG: hypothetical protein ACRCXC_05695 [Legionella sp.]